MLGTISYYYKNYNIQLIDALLGMQYRLNSSSDYFDQKLFKIINLIGYLTIQIKKYPLRMSQLNIFSVGAKKIYFLKEIKKYLHCLEKIFDFNCGRQLDVHYIDV